MKHSKQSELPRSKAEALALGVTRYFNGTVCKRGHTAPRSLSSNCTECQRISAAAKRDPAERAEYYRRNRERERETNRAYCAAEKDRLRQIAVEYRRENRDRLIAKNAAWRAANPAYGAEHRNENRDRYIVYAQNRRGRLTTGTLSKNIVARLLDLQRGCCACCGEALGDDFHLDHITPLARGGLNVDANVQLLLGRCNLAKATSDPVEYMQRKGKLL